jgi:GTP cyclohydrolase I
MEIKKITDLIENFAPLELQEAWDCSGWQIDFGQCEIKKILLCVSVTQSIINQAIAGKFDLIIAHHPLFFIPFEFNKNIPIYSAHTNLDKAEGGTTDTLIEEVFGGLHSNQPDAGGLVNPPYFDDSSMNANCQIAQKVVCGDFLRLVALKNEINLDDFVKLLKEKLNIESLRVVNNLNKTKVSKIALCAGSGVDFLGEAEKIDAHAFVTGDVKYHQALESNVIIIDVGHFESERPILKKIKKILEPLTLEVVEANEKSPFINY